MNWLTDWQAQTPVSAKLFFPPNFKEVHEQCELLHFDNLYTPEHVAVCWTQFYKNVRQAYDAIVKGDEASKIGESKEFALLSLLGIAFHAIQDFYTHSTFSELIGYPNRFKKLDGKRNCLFYAETYIPFDSQNPTLENPQSLRSGYSGANGRKFAAHPELKPEGAEPHGGYTSGLNKDAYHKKGFEASYVDAFMQSISFLDTLYGWLRKDKQLDLWTKMRTIYLSDEDFDSLENSRKYAFSVSAFIINPKNRAAVDGHWKGPGSGRVRRAAGHSLKFLSKQKSLKFLKPFWKGETLKILTQGLREDEIVSQADDKSITEHLNVRKELAIRRAHAAEFDVVRIQTKRIKLPKHTDEDDGFVAKIVTYDNQVFVDAPMRSNAEVPRWVSLWFIVRSHSRVSFTYHLFTEDGAFEAYLTPAAKKTTGDGDGGIFDKIEKGARWVADRVSSKIKAAIHNFAIFKGLDDAEDLHSAEGASFKLSNDDDVVTIRNTDGKYRRPERVGAEHMYRIVGDQSRQHAASIDLDVRRGSLCEVKDRTADVTPKQITKTWRQKFAAAAKKIVTMNALQEGADKVIKPSQKSLKDKLLGSEKDSLNIEAQSFDNIR
jgi:hypothetical protein